MGQVYRANAGNLRADWRQCTVESETPAMTLQFATRLNNVETSAIRELFKLLGKPGIISFAGGFPDSAMFDVAGIKESAARALSEEPGAALQYGATEGYEPLRTQLSHWMKAKGAHDVEPQG